MFTDVNPSQLFFSVIGRLSPEKLLVDHLKKNYSLEDLKSNLGVVMAEHARDRLSTNHPTTLKEKLTDLMMLIGQDICRQIFDGLGSPHVNLFQQCLSSIVQTIVQSEPNEEVFASIKPLAGFLDENKEATELTLKLSLPPQVYATVLATLLSYRMWHKIGEAALKG